MGFPGILPRTRDTWQGCKVRNTKTLKCPAGMQRPRDGIPGGGDACGGGGMRGMQRFWDAWLGCPDFEMPGRDTTVQPLGLPGRGVGTRPARSRPRLNRAASLRPLHAPAGPAGSGSSVLLLGRADTAPSSRWETVWERAALTERGSPAPESGRNVTLECRHRSTPRVAPRLRWLPVWAGLARSC